MAKLVLIRGLPGSGKSTAAKGMSGYFHVEADMFFMKNGTYKFELSRVLEAHKWCQKLTRDMLSKGSDVVVSNAFTRHWEMEPYRSMGADSIKVITMFGEFTNMHGMPPAVIKMLKDRWED